MSASLVVIVPVPDPSRIAPGDVPFGPETGAYMVQRGDDFIAIYTAHPKDEVRARPSFYATAVRRDFPNVFARATLDSRGLLLVPESELVVKGSYASFVKRVGPSALWLAHPAAE